MSGEIVEIERPQTESEKREFILLGATNVYDFFSAKLAEKSQEYTRKHLPFDEQCARLEFRDAMEKAQRESQRIYGYTKEDINIIKITRRIFPI
jgi:hypothetical protein